MNLLEHVAFNFPLEVKATYFTLCKLHQSKGNIPQRTEHLGVLPLFTETMNRRHWKCKMTMALTFCSAK